MQNKEFCVYNETRENVLSSRVTVIDTKADPLKVVKALIEGPGPHQEAGLWLNPLKSFPLVSTLSPYDLVYLDQDCRVLHSVAVIPDNEVPQFTGQASSALLLPLHTFTASQTHPGDRFVICAFEEIERLPVHVSVSSTPVPLASVHAVASVSMGTEVPSPLVPSLFVPGPLVPGPPSGASSQRPQTATWHFEPLDKQNNFEVETKSPGNHASKIGFLRGIVHLRLHISISMAPSPHAVADAKPAAVAPAAQWSGNLSLHAPAQWLGKCSAQWSKQRAALKTRILQPLHDLFQQRVRATVAAFCQRIAKAARSGAARGIAQTHFLRLRYLRWADEFIFRPTHTSTPSTAVIDSAKHRPPFDDRRRRLLKARFLR